MNRIEINKTSLAASAAGLADATVCTGAGPWIPTTTELADELAHLVTITQAGITDHSAKTAVITGTDAGGSVVTETVNLPNGAATVTSTKHFSTILSVVISATIGTDTMTLGWSASSVSIWKGVIPGLPLGFGCTVGIGSPTYTVQYTYDGVSAFDHDDITAQVVSSSGEISKPFKSFRLAFAAAGQVILTGYQY